MGKGLTERFGALFAVLIAVGTLYAQPAINIVANAAADAVSTGNVARGELISIYGTNLATSLGANFTPTSPVFSLAGASVTIGGLPAPITYASPTQLDVQVPFEIAAGVTSANLILTVTYTNLGVVAATYSSSPYPLNIVGQDVGMAYAQVGTQIFNVSSANTAIVQAPVGSQLAIVAFGLGSVTPAVASGIIPPAGTTFNTVLVPSVTINGAAVAPSSSTLVGLGVYAVTVTIPAGSSGDLTVKLAGSNCGTNGSTGSTGPTGPTGAMGPTGPTG